MSNRISLEKYADIFRDLKVSDIMTENVVTLTPEKKISRAKEIMKIQQISGIPIVDKRKKVVGIISIQDIINALEYNKVEDPLSTLMSRNVVTARPDETISEMVEKFTQFKVHRFPVVNEKGHIEGIVTRENVLHGIIEKFNIIYVHDQKRTTMLNSNYSPITGEQLTSEQAEFHYKIDNSDITTAGSGAALLQQFLKKRGTDSEISRKVGIVTYEAETNVVIHSKSEGDIYCFIKDDRIIVRVIDSGIGIEDLDKAMTEGFTTADEYVRGHGFGAGMGIPNMKRFSDKLVILSEKKVGTQVEVVFFLKNEEE